MNFLKQSAISLFACSALFGASGGMLGSPANPANPAYYTGAINGGYSANGANVKILKGDSFAYAYGGSDYGSGDRSTKNNTLIIDGGEVSTHAYGGFATALQNGNAISANNTLIIQNSPASVLPDDVYGGAANATHGDAIAYGNTVILLNGKMDDVLAARANSDFGSAVASGNTMVLAGGDVAGALRGGRVVRTGTQIDNILESFSGNSLHFVGYQGASKMSTISDFEFYHFYMPKNLFYPSANYVMLQGGDLRAKVASVNIAGGGARLNLGDKITLLYADSFYSEIENKGAVISGKQGILWDYDFLLGQDTHTLNATVLRAKQSDEAKFLPQSNEASLQALNQGGDLAMNSLKELKAASISKNSTIDFIPFFNVSAGSVKTALRTNAANFIAGFGVKKEHGFGSGIVAPFVESGFGSYSSDLISGNGDISYYGGGLMGRFIAGGAYFDAMLRLGKIKNSFKESKINFEQNKNYWGFGAGVGYILDFGEHQIDASAKYIYTHISNGELDIYGDNAEFNSINSKRLKVGARYSYTGFGANGYAYEPFLGAYYERELGSGAKVSVNRLYEIKSDEAKKNTAVFELGVNVKGQNGLSLQASANGYAGGKKGAAGNLKLTYEF